MGDEYREQEGRDQRERGRSRSRDRTQNNDSGSACIHISNLSQLTTEDTIRAAFEQVGPIESISIVREPHTNASRGFGFVTFVNPDDADNAVKLSKEVIIDDRHIAIEKSRRNRAYEKTPGRYLGNPRDRVVRRPSDDSRPPPRDYPSSSYDGGRMSSSGGYPRGGGYDDRYYDSRDHGRGDYPAYGGDRDRPYDDRGRGYGGGGRPPYDDRYARPAYDAPRDYPRGDRGGDHGYGAGDQRPPYNGGRQEGNNDYSRRYVDDRYRRPSPPRGRDGYAGGYR